MEWYLEVWRKFAQFDGRSRRKEYWMFTLFNSLIMMALYLAAVLVLKGLLAIYFIYCLAALVPSMACAVRRLHDAGKSGWWLLITLLPIIGLLIIVYLASDSIPGTNQYGPNPKEPVPATLIG